MDRRRKPIGAKRHRGGGIIPWRVSDLASADTDPPCRGRHMQPFEANPAGGLRGCQEFRLHSSGPVCLHQTT